jgi:hypothetical protein
MAGKVWIYLSDKELSTEMKASIAVDCDAFLKEWNAHGNMLTGSAEILHNRFIVIKIDETGYAASGCSIDKQVQFIKVLEQKYNISLLNRLLVAYKENCNAVTVKPANEVKRMLKEGSLSLDTIYFDAAIVDAHQFATSFEIPISKSWLMPQRTWFNWSLGN